VPDKRPAPHRKAVPWILAGTSAALIGGGVLIASAHGTPPASRLDHPVAWPGSRTPATPGQAAQQPRHTPAITIPGKGTTQVVAEGIGSDRSLGVPADVHTVGWDVYSAAMDSAAGSTVLDGHVNYAGQGAGFFSDLASTHPGEVISTTSPTGIASHWRITSQRLYLKDHGLPASLFSPGGPRRLVLISCGGAFDWSTGHYLSNVVVVAVPA
jgi:hypothetical protein